MVLSSRHWNPTHLGNVIFFTISLCGYPTYRQCVDSSVGFELCGYFSIQIRCLLHLRSTKWFYTNGWGQSFYFCLWYLSKPHYFWRLLKIEVCDGTEGLWLKTPYRNPWQAPSPRWHTPFPSGKNVNGTISRVWLCKCKVCWLGAKESGILQIIFKIERVTASGVVMI